MPKRVIDLRQEWIYIGALGVFFGVLCFWTWGRWGSLAVDCGREMYVPYAINSGQRLYFDIWYPYGPLVPYFHAALFRMFGTHLLVLYVMGLVVSASVASILYRISRQFLPPELASVCIVVFLLLAFQMRLFNYILPYAYPAPYGVLLNSALLLLLLDDIVVPSSFKLFRAGIIAGLVALTKIEFGVAAFAILAVAVFLRTLKARSWTVFGVSLLMCGPGAVLCAAVYAYLVYASSLRFIFDDNIPILPDSYFRVTVPYWYPTLSLGVSAKWTALVMVQTALVILAVILASKYRRARPALAVAVIGIGAVHIIPQMLRWDVPDLVLQIAPFWFFNRGIAWMAALLFIASLFIILRRGYTPAVASLVLLSASAFFIAIRQANAMGTWGYAIFYAPLAYVVWIVVVYRGAIFILPRIQASEWRFIGALLCVGAVVLTGQQYRPKLNRETLVFKRGTISTDPPTAKVMKEAVSFARSAAARKQSVVVWPEELSVYFFSETFAPSRWTIILPGVLPAHRQHEYTAELDRKKVNYVILTDRITDEYRKSFFGEDYDQEVYRWLTENFHVIREIGVYQRMRMRDWSVDLTGALVWERNESELNRDQPIPVVH